ncbi:MAG: hypothetical protein KIH01_04905, partial [Candidatus Freyarchaeota archaeon]|nr:hypothetical protein [Candidatus Jordarchaeia archaeon]
MLGCLLRHGILRSLALILPDAISLSLIAALSAILLAANPPLLVDDFYHLSVSRQICVSGFIPTWDFWEFAPLGRPHLYPPLLHLAMAFLIKASGGEVLLAAKVVKASVYPLLLLLFWLSVRGLEGREAALYSTLTLASASPLLLLATMIMPATVALAITPPLLLSFIKRKTLTSALLLSAAMWLHVSMPLTAAASLLAFSLVKRDGYPKLFIKVASISTITYLPWLLHVANHAGWLSPAQASGSPFIPFTVWALALPSMASTLRHKDSGCLAFLLYALSLTLLVGYTTRFSVYLLLPASFFTGVTLSRIMWNRRKLKAALIVILAASF